MSVRILSEPPTNASTQDEHQPRSAGPDQDGTTPTAAQSIFGGA